MRLLAAISTGKKIRNTSLGYGNWFLPIDCTFSQEAIQSDQWEVWENLSDEALPIKGVSVNSTLDEAIKVHTLNVLKDCGGMKSKTANRLKIDRKTLYRMLARYKEEGECF